MFVYGSLMVLIAGLQVISAQGPPGFGGHECHRPPPGVERPFDCCKIPPMFEPKDFEECGFKKHEEGEAPPEGPRGPPPPPPDENEIGEDPDQNLEAEVKQKWNGTRKHWHGHRFPLHPPHGRRGRNCSKQLCLLQKYGMASEGVIDDEAVVKFMDAFKEKNTEFGPAVDKAKEKCIGRELPGPPHICPANKLMFCVSHTVFADCPKWEESEGCQTLKDHMEKCKQFFP